MSTLSANRIGAITEEIIITELLKHDISVSRPVMDEPYDLIAEKNGQCFRIQCKTAHSRRKGTVRFRTTSESGDYIGLIDYFATEHSGNAYFLHVNEVSKGYQDLRIHENGKRSTSKMLKNYSIKNFLLNFEQ
jgi:hypothetical protein